MKIKFNDPESAIRYCAKQNENHFCFVAAARLYREIGDEESALRCEVMSGQPNLFQSTPERQASR